jgi:hypothetical protein
LVRSSRAHQRLALPLPLPHLLDPARRHAPGEAAELRLHGHVYEACFSRFVEEKEKMSWHGGTHELGRRIGKLLEHNVF